MNYGNPFTVTASVLIPQHLEISQSAQGEFASWVETCDVEVSTFTAERNKRGSRNEVQIRENTFTWFPC